MVLVDTSPPCPSSAGIAKWTFKALGTQCSIQFAAESREQAGAFRKAVQDWMLHFEGTWSRFRPDSLISRINANAGGAWTEIDAEAEAMFDLAGEVHFATGGLIDASSLPISWMWKDAASHQRIPSDETVAETKHLCGWEKVERKAGAIRLPEANMGLDIGGFGKEFAVDYVAAIARNHGIRQALIDFGGDVIAFGGSPENRPWRIGLEDTNRPGKPWAAAQGNAFAVASSGDFKRFVEIKGRRFGHIIDARTGFPPHHSARLVTVSAATCLQAGILSTVCFVLGPREGLERLESEPGVEGCIQVSDTLLHTSDFHTLLHHEP